MRKLFSLMAAGALLVGAASTQASVLPATGVIGLQIATLSPILVPPASPPVPILVNGSNGGGHLNSFAISAGQFSTVGLVVPITDPAVVNTIGGIVGTAINASGGFAGGSAGPLGGIMPIAGFAKVCLFGPCSAAVQNLAVPLTPVGQGGIAFVNAAVKITVVGSPWTIGTVPVGTVTQMGFVHGPGTLTSSTAQPSGVVTLVSPLFVSTSLATSFPVVPAFAFFQLHFVPEPGTMLLLGSGIAGLVLIGRSRKQS